MIQSSDTPQQDKSPLRQLRETAGLSRFQVRQHIGVSEKSQSDWELNNVIPSAENLAALARLYKVSLRTIYQSVGIDLTDIPLDDSSKSVNFSGNQSKKDGIVSEDELFQNRESFLRNLRGKLDMSQEQLAVTLGKTAKTLSLCERGKTELTLTIQQFKKLGELASRDRLSEFPDYLGKPPEQEEDQ